MRASTSRWSDLLDVSLADQCILLRKTAGGEDTLGSRERSTASGCRSWFDPFRK